MLWGITWEISTLYPSKKPLLSCLACFNKDSVKGVSLENFWQCCLCENTRRDEDYKLENQSQKCVLLGRGGTSWGFKVYNPITKKVATSRDVQLDGEQLWKWSNEG